MNLNLDFDTNLDYNDCTKEQLIALLYQKDENFVELGNCHLRMSEGLNRVLEGLANESLGITRLMQTEITLQNAGVDSKDSKLIMEREFGKLQAYQQLINMLMPIYENK
jgi:hypothetical protein